MASSNVTCQSDILENFLRGKLDRAAERLLEAHLDACPQCQHMLQKHAAGPEAWREVSELLGSESNRSPNSLLGSPVLGTEDAADALALEGICKLLAPTDDPDMLGRIDNYEISGVIGWGGMGAVLKGYDRTLKRVVAIKLLAPHQAHSDAARKRFRREAQAAAAVTHDNVVEIYAVAEAQGMPYIVMPYARGESLQKRLDQRGPLPLVEILRIGTQVASGLVAAHSQGLVHRDIKPANILLNDGIERLLITDFGLARAVDDVSLTRTGIVAGTPRYMSPEQARGETVDARSDLFSLGSVLYTACTGRPPFAGDSAYGILRRISDEVPTPIREWNPEIPVWLCKVIENLHAKAPADRYQSADDVAAVLRQCLAHVQCEKAFLPKELLTTHAGIPFGRPKAWIAATLLVLSLAIAGSFFVKHTQPATKADPLSGTEAHPPEATVTSADQRVSEEQIAWDDQLDDSIDGLHTQAMRLDRETRFSFDPIGD